MARLLLGFIKPTSGQIIYQGVDVAKMDRAQARQYRREVQPIFQDPFEVYNPFYKVDNVLSTPLRNFGLAKDGEGRPAPDGGVARAGRACGRGRRSAATRTSCPVASDSGSWWPGR